MYGCLWNIHIEYLCRAPCMALQHPSGASGVRAVHSSAGPPWTTGGPAWTTCAARPTARRQRGFLFRPMLGGPPWTTTAAPRRKIRPEEVRSCAPELPLDPEGGHAGADARMPAPEGARPIAGDPAAGPRRRLESRDEIPAGSRRLSIRRARSRFAPPGLPRPMHEHICRRPRAFARSCAGSCQPRGDPSTRGTERLPEPEDLRSAVHELCQGRGGEPGAGDPTSAAA